MAVRERESGGGAKNDEIRKKSDKHNMQKRESQPDT